ncbi:nuclear transport factor 2 family protein [Actinomadura logoneensis]|nr:nuclear transport factor 2 family protein [Actinomadura logoneensis]
MSEQHPGKPERTMIDTWIERYGRAWHDKDADGVAELFTEDATYAAHPVKEPHRGRAAIRAYWRQATATQSDLRLHFGRPVVDGDRVAVEWWATMDDPDWGPSRDDAAATMPGCLLLRFTDEGLCAGLREYWNVEFGRNVPAPVGWGE